MEQNINLLNYERGDLVPASEVNVVIADAYNKVNFLTHENVGTVSTGQFIGEDVFVLMTFPNYCGKLESRDTVSPWTARHKGRT